MQDHRELMNAFDEDCKIKHQPAKPCAVGPKNEVNFEKFQENS